MHPLHHESHGPRNLVERHDDRACHAVPEHRPHRLQHRAAAGAVDKRALPCVEAAGAPCRERPGQRRRRSRFGGIQPDRRVQRLQCTSDPRQQPATAGRRDYGVHVGEVFEDLERDRAVAADEIIVVKRVHEVTAHAVGPARLDRAPALVVRRPHDGGAESLDRAQLGFGSRVHHEHAGRDPQMPRRQSHTLSGIAGADRPDPLREPIGREPPHGVVGPSDLEGANRLEGLQLEEDLGRVRLGGTGGTGRLEPDERCTDDNVVDDRRRTADRVDGNAAFSGPLRRRQRPCRQGHKQRS